MLGSKWANYGQKERLRANNSASAERLLEINRILSVIPSVRKICIICQDKDQVKNKRCAPCFEAGTLPMIEEW